MILSRLSAPIHLAALLGLVAALLGVAACATTESAQPQHSWADAAAIDPPFYRIAPGGDDTTGVLYLLGSFHVGPADGWRFATPVGETLAAADVVALEIDLFSLSQAEQTQLSLHYGMLPAGTRLQSAIGDALYARLSARLAELGMAPGAWDGMRPWLAATALAILDYTALGLGAETGVDLSVLSRVRSDQQLVELETFEQQMQMLASLSTEAGVEMLREALAPEAERIALVTELLELWSGGNDDALASYLREQMLGAGGERVYEVLVAERNLTMSDALAEQLALGGTIFATVGAAHVVGEDGIASLLAQRGLQVERVRPQ